MGLLYVLSMTGVFIQHLTPAHPLQGRVKVDKIHKDKPVVKMPKDTAIKRWTHQVLEFDLAIFELKSLNWLYQWTSFFFDLSITKAKSS